MKQRVKLAQALVHGPRLLLLDEPTNGLDPAGRDEMLALVRRTGTEFGIAVIVASHLLGEIERVCDFLVAIDAGRLLRAAPLGSFTERTGVLAVEVEEGEEALAAALVGARAAGRRRRPDGPPGGHRGRASTTSSATPSPSSGCRSSASSSAARASRTCSGTRCPRPGAAAAGRQRPPRAAARHDDVTRRRRAPQSPADRAAASTTSATRPTTGRGWVVGARSSRSSRRRSARASGSGAAVGPRSRPFALAALAILPAVLAVGFAALAAQAGRPAALGGRLADQLRELPRPRRHPDHAVLRRPGTRAVRARPALRRPAALLLAGPDPDRLRAGQGRRPDRRAASLVEVSPYVILFVGRVFVAPDPVDRAADEIGAVPRFLLQGVLVAGLLGGIAGLIAAYTPRRAYATAAIIAVFIIPPIIVAIVGGQTSQDLARVDHLLQPGRHPRRHERGDLRVDPRQPGRGVARPARLGVRRGGGGRDRRGRSG